jgi:hypothetical protein
MLTSTLATLAFLTLVVVGTQEQRRRQERARWRTWFVGYYSG